MYVLQPRIIDPFFRQIQNFGPCEVRGIQKCPPSMGLSTEMDQPFMGGRSRDKKRKYW